MELVSKIMNTDVTVIIALFFSALKKLVASIACTKFSKCRPIGKEKIERAISSGFFSAILNVKYSGNKIHSEPNATSKVTVQFVDFLITYPTPVFVKI
ncbi:hypothetical protein D3C80_1544640 [compost metagenome]